MYVLTVDTSTSYVVAGIVEVSDSAAEVTSGEQSQVSVLAERVVDNPRGHMELLTPNIVDCLAEAGLSPEQLGAVVVGVGPGPFTGLRVGMATAQAFADALSIPVHGVESTAAMAVRSILEQRRNGVSNLDERRAPRPRRRPPSRVVLGQLRPARRGQFHRLVAVHPRNTSGTCSG